MSHNHACPGGHVPLTRRAALLGLATAGVLGRTRIAFAGNAQGAPSAPRLVVINTMGGLDGLAAVAPYGDPNLAKLRPSILLPPVGTPGGMLDMGGFYGLHPSLVNLHAMYQAGEALAVHAVGMPGGIRSHFTGQDYLQSGAPELLTSGWLDRAASFLGGPTQSGLAQSVMVDSQSPLILRGSYKSASWAPSAYPVSPASLACRVVQMSSADPLLGPAFSTGLSNRTWIDATLAAAPIPQSASPLVTLASAAGDMLAANGGPTVAAIATNSFDTHDNQLARLTSGLSDLDNALLALKTTLGAAWANTVVLTMTEFGRTAYCNGGGTDHGTAFAVFLAGGAVAGGKVVATWPGLSPTNLFQGRDLAPTVDFRAVAATILQEHMGLSASALAAVFPGAGALSNLGGLLH